MKLGSERYSQHSRPGSRDHGDSEANGHNVEGQQNDWPLHDDGHRGMENVEFKAL